MASAFAKVPAYWRLCLNRGDVERVTAGHLTKFEIDALMKRRDLLVTHFEKLVAEKGEGAVLY